MQKVIAVIVVLALVFLAALSIARGITSGLDALAIRNGKSEVAALKTQLDSTKTELREKDNSNSRLLAELQKKDDEYFQLLMEFFGAEVELNSAKSKAEAMESLVREQYPVSPDEESPWQRYMSFMAQMYAGNADGTWEYFSLQDKAGCSKENFRAFFVSYIFGESEPSAPPNYVFIDQAVGTNGIIAAVGFLTDGGSLNIVSLLAENGEWHLASLELAC